MKSFIQLKDNNEVFQVVPSTTNYIDQVSFVTFFIINVEALLISYGRMTTHSL